MEGTHACTHEAKRSVAATTHTITYTREYYIIIYSGASEPNS